MTNSTGKDLTVLCAPVGKREVVPAMTRLPCGNVQEFDLVDASNAAYVSAFSINGAGANEYHCCNVVVECGHHLTIDNTKGFVYLNVLT